MRRRSFSKVLCVLAAGLTAYGSCVAIASAHRVTRPHAAKVGSQPSTYAANNSRTGYSNDSSITTRNAARLLQRWHLTVTAPISDQPIVHDGVIYWGDWNGDMHATTVSGRKLWSTPLGVEAKPSACPFQLATQGIVSSPTVATLRGRTVVWVGGGDGQLVALSASNGKIVWRSVLGAAPEHVLWSSPALYRGSIYEGVASFNDCPEVNAGFYRVNASTGAVQAMYQAPAPAGCMGAGVWSSPSISPSDNSVYITTGNFSPETSCISPYQNAILKLDATSLAVRAHWQVPPAQQSSDSDFGASAMLFSATVGGVHRNLVGAENKNGVYYVFDQRNLAAGPIWSRRVEPRGALTNGACPNTISTSAWAGGASDVLVVGVTPRGKGCAGTLAALDPSTGRAKWQVRLQGGILGAVTEVRGLVAVGAGRYVDLLSTTTGRMLFSFAEPRLAKPGKQIYGAPVNWFWSPPTISANTLLIANGDGRLRAFVPRSQSKRR
jgi:polyvinyl alcohol dehydrogenase (cytochrome)